MCKKEFYAFNFALILRQFPGKAVKIQIGQGGDFFLYGRGIILSLGFIYRSRISVFCLLQESLILHAWERFRKII
ncbi:MAG: hypothetical protein B6I30_03180 [Desulfobacteraceae bacterium 4572_187]|nr:MAG: hypothetical protein B6I30_03180 [Desulfobacteraceae bacterium 4572_187]